MMIDRRKFLTVSTGFALAASFGRWSLASQPPALQAAIASSDLIYLTPLHQDGGESRCQAEVWFVADGEALCIVTAKGAWRARAVRSGLARARIWVGDVGQWKSSGGKYRSLPQLETVGALVTDKSQQERILDLYSSKYRVEWILWGSRFREGLADGSRVMLRYDRA